MEHNTPGTTETTVVVQWCPFLSGEAQSELLEGELVFDPSDPYAVSMNLEARSGTRDLDLRPRAARRRASTRPAATATSRSGPA